MTERAGPDGICSRRTWRWASGIVQLRSIILPDLDMTVDHAEGLDAAGKALLNELKLNKQPRFVLVPTLDLCNHAGGQANARWEAALVQQKLVLKVIALRDIARDSEITVSYGDDKSNVELRFNYGFQMPKNPVVSSRIGLDTKGRGQIDQYITIKVDLGDDPHADKYDEGLSGLRSVEDYWGCVTQDWKNLVSLYFGISGTGPDVKQWLLSKHTNEAWRGHMATVSLAAILHGHVKRQHQRLQVGLAQLTASESAAGCEDAAETIGGECACLDHALEHLHRMKRMNMGAMMSMGR